VRSGTGLGPQQRRASRPLRSGTLLEEKRWVLEELKNREGHPGTRSALRWVPGHRCAGERGSAPPRAMEAGVAGHHAPRPRRQRLLVPVGRPWRRRSHGSSSHGAVGGRLHRQRGVPCHDVGTLVCLWGARIPWPAEPQGRRPSAECTDGANRHRANGRAGPGSATALPRHWCTSPERPTGHGMPREHC